MRARGRCLGSGSSVVLLAMEHVIRPTVCARAVTTSEALHANWVLEAQRTIVRRARSWMVDCVSVSGRVLLFLERGHDMHTVRERRVHEQKGLELMRPVQQVKPILEQG